MGPSSQALARLRALLEQKVDAGDVWWLPPSYVKSFGSGKRRPYMVVARETTTGGTPDLIHIVAGSKQKTTGPHVLDTTPPECGLSIPTYFKFISSAYGTISVADLVNDGQYCDRLDAQRIPEIAAAVKASKVQALKRVLSS